MQFSITSEKRASRRFWNAVETSSLCVPFSALTGTALGYLQHLSSMCRADSALNANIEFTTDYSHTEDSMIMVIKSNLWLLSIISMSTPVAKWLSWAAFLPQFSLSVDVPRDNYKSNSSSYVKLLNSELQNSTTTTNTQKKSECVWIPFNVVCPTEWFTHILQHSTFTTSTIFLFIRGPGQPLLYRQTHKRTIITGPHPTSSLTARIHSTSGPSSHVHSQFSGPSHYYPPFRSCSVHSIIIPYVRIHSKALVYVCVVTPSPLFMDHSTAAGFKWKPVCFPEFI